MTLVNSILLLAGAGLLSYLVNWAFKYVVPKIVIKTKSDTDDRIVAAVRFPVTVSIVVGAVVLILEPVAMRAGWANYFNLSLISILTLVWAWALAKVSGAIIDEIDHRLKRKHDILSFFKSLSSLLIIGIGLVVILVIWEIDVTPLLAAGGVAGIAVAFAAKDTIANIFGGVSIFLDRPYKMGDYILIDGTERGEVISIGARTTKIKTRDDVLISIPNSIMATSKIVNETGLNPPLRIKVMVGMPYDCDLEKAEKTLWLSIAAVEDILEHPEPRVRFREFGDSSINAEVMGWVKDPEDKGRVMHELIKQIKKDLDKAGISIPFPQRDVHLHKSK